MNQSRLRTEYDANYDSCYAVTSQESDLWNGGSNITHYEYQNVLACDYCTPSLINTTWSDWANISCVQFNLMNQSRSRIQYDENYCGETGNLTFYEYQLNGDCIFSDNQPPITTAFLNDKFTYNDQWHSSNISITFSCSDNVACDATYYCIDQNNTCDPWAGSKYLSAFNHTLDGIYYLRYASNDSWSNIEQNHSVILKKAESLPKPKWNRYQNNDTTDFNNTPLINSSRISIGVPNIAKVTFNGPVDLIQHNGTDFVEIDLDAYINISLRRISINSSALPMLNTSANLTFYNITYENPQVEKDDALFTNYSTLQSPNSSNNHTLIINVSSFSTYEVVEGPYCGDNVCNNGETSSTCSADCSSGGSSGGGGSGSSAPALPPTYLTVDDGWTEYTFYRTGVIYFNISADLHRAVFSNADADSLTFSLLPTNEVYSVTANQSQQIDLNGTLADLIYTGITGNEITLKLRRHENIAKPTPQIIEEQNKTLPQISSPKEVLESLQPDVEEPASNESKGSILLTFVIILFISGVLGTGTIYYKLHKTTAHKSIILGSLSKKHDVPKEHVEKIYHWLVQCHVKDRLEEGANVLKEKGWKEELIEEIRKMF